MKRTLSVLLALGISLMMGCGSSTSKSTSTGTNGSTGATGTTGPSSPVYPSLGGNWSITATSTSTKQTFLIGGSVTNTNASVSGIIYVLNSPCYSLSQAIAVTGSLDPSGAVTLKSSAINGQTLTITGSASTGVLTSGNYAIAGGCGDKDAGTVTGFSVPSYANAYTGSFIPNGTYVPIFVNITAQQSGPDAAGLYHLSGNATFGSSLCFGSGTITSSIVSGSYMYVLFNTNLGTQVEFYGYVTNPPTMTIVGTFRVLSGVCSGNTGTGTIQKV